VRITSIRPRERIAVERINGRNWWKREMGESKRMKEKGRTSERKRETER